MIAWRAPSRRAFLRAAGTSLALPWLESLDPRPARAAVTKRFLAFFIPNGCWMPAWTPAAEGPDYPLSPTLAPLGPLKQDISVLSGIDNKPGVPRGPGDHSAGTGAFLTCAYPQPGRDTVYVGMSLDQHAARRIGAVTPFPSLVLAIDPGTTVGTCGLGSYNCTYRSNISWSGPSTPAAKIVDPQVAFDRLFGTGNEAASKAESERRRREQRSVLDFVLGDMRTLASKLGQTDRRKLEEYATGVRELELRASADVRSAGACSAERPGPNLAVPDRVKAMLDIMVLAFQCDLTRVITFMLAEAQGSRSYPFLGVPENHHALSHHGGRLENAAKLRVIEEWEIRQLAYLLGRLKSTADGPGGTLLDSAVVYLSSEVSDGNAHSHQNLPILVAGRAGGALRPGRHVRYRGAALANLYLSFLAALDMPAASFGADGTEPLADL